MSHDILSMLEGRNKPLLNMTLINRISKSSPVSPATPIKTVTEFKDPDACIFCSTCLEVHNSAKARLCGHYECSTCAPSISPRLTSCPICTLTTRNIKKYSPLEWLEKEIVKHRFIILIYYRGVWREFLKYLKSMNNIIDTIRRLGGEIFAITSKHTPLQISNTKTMLRFPIVSDYKETIATKYNIEILSTRRSSIDALKAFAFNFKVHQASSDHCESLLPQPGIVILSQKFNHEKQVFKFTGAENDSLMNKYRIKRVLPQDVLNIVNFYFQEETQLDSARVFLNQHKVELFDAFLSNIHMRNMFAKHLADEMILEDLQFLEDVQTRFVDVISTGSEAFDELIDIYSTYIMESGSKQIALPFAIIKEIDQYFIIEDGIVSVDTKRGTDKYFTSSTNHVFYKACTFVKRQLCQDTFNRFITSEKFQIEGAYALVKSCIGSYDA
jgi:peroxiredoxin